MANGQAQTADKWEQYAAPPPGSETADKWEKYAAKPSPPTGNTGTVEHPLVTPRAGESFEETMRRGVEMGKRVTPGQIQSATEGAVRDVPTVIGAASAPGIATGLAEGVTGGLPGLFKLGRGLIGAGAGAGVGARIGEAAGTPFGETGKEVGGVLGSIGGGVVGGGLGWGVGREPFTGKIKPLPFGIQRFIPEFMVPRGAVGSVTNPVEAGLPSNVFEPAPGKFVTLEGRMLEGARQTALPESTIAAQRAEADFAAGKPGPFQRITESPKYPEIKAARAAAASAGEAVPLTESPNYPRIAAGREAAMREARESLPSGQYTPLSESPNAPRTTARREFAEGKAGPFNLVSQSPNLPTTRATATGPLGDISESVAGTKPRSLILTPEEARTEELRQAQATKRASERGMQFAGGMTPREGRTVPRLPTSRPTSEFSGVRERIPLTTDAQMHEAERILDDPLATGTQKQAARQFLEIRQ